MSIKKILSGLLIVGFIVPAAYSLYSAVFDTSNESSRATKYAQGIAYLHARAVFGSGLDRFIPKADSAYSQCVDIVADGSMACDQSALMARYDKEPKGVSRDAIREDLFFAKSHGVCPVARAPLCEDVSWFTWLTLYAGRCSCAWRGIG